MIHTDTQILRHSYLISLLTMLEKYAADFYDLGVALSALSGIINPNLKTDVRQDVKHPYKTIGDVLSTVNRLCQSIGLTASTIQAQRFQELFNTDIEESPEARQLLFRQLNDLRQRISDELGGRMFWFIEPSKVSFYQENQFTDSVVDNLPTAIYDMEEAGKCLALGRDTACAFHLMRVIETGLSQLTKELGIEGHCKSWNETCKKIKTHIDGLSEITKKDKLTGILERIYSIKDVWRNPTMHVDRQYSGEEAREVFDATKRFMKVLGDYTT